MQMSKKMMARGALALLVALTMVASFFLPFGASALADEAVDVVEVEGEQQTVSTEEGVDVQSADEGILEVAADASLKSETITPSSATTKGTKFQVHAEGTFDPRDGIHINTEHDVSYGVVVSSLDNTTIKKVYVRFSYFDLGYSSSSLVVDHGQLSGVTELDYNEAEATIENVNATSVRLTSSCSDAEDNAPCVGEVTVYYEGKYPNTLQASAVKATQTLTYKTSAQALKAADVFKVSGAKGAVTYSKKSGDAGISVASDGKVTVKKGQAVGNYKVVFSVKAAGDATYEAATKDVAVTFAVNKAKNPITATAVAKKAKASKVAKKAVTVKRPMKVSNAQGKLQFAKVKSGSSKYLTVNKNTGKVTVKKGTKKGTYKIKIKVTAKGTSNYKAGSKTVKCTVKVV